MDLVTHLFNQKLFNLVNMSTTQSSAPFNINGCSCYATQYIWSGFSGTVSVTLQASNDGVNFTAIDTFVLSGASNNRMLNVEKAGYAWIQVVCNSTGGAGLLTVIVNGKVI